MLPDSHLCFRNRRTWTAKPMYREKPFSHTPRMAWLSEAAKKSDRIVMAGAYRTSSVLSAQSERTLRPGRNGPTGAWEYPPADLSPENLNWDTWLGAAPKKTFDPLVFARWRCWKER